MNYIDNLDKQIKDYFRIIEPNFPNWLNDYINTKELLHQQYISVTCGTIYSNLFESNIFYSSLDHSIGVALIIWHFTHDKKQTLSGLFHDIATPAFKHCVDFLNGDYMNQESTEELTTEIIKNSKEIMKLLERDNIKLEEVDNYHLYPIADNDTPKLSADRLEYSLSNGLITYNLVDAQTIEKMYNDITIKYNEENTPELGFSTKEIALSFLEMTSKLSIIYREDRTRYSMQFIADILLKLSEEGKITKEDLYKIKEQDIIQMIELSKYSEAFKAWQNASYVKTSDTKPENVYWVNHGAKIRYIDPLLNNERLSKINENASKILQKNLSYNMNKYVYLDLNI